MGWPRPIARLLGLLGVRGAPADPHDRRARGALAEREAARFLRGLGYRVLGRNVRLRCGEADLVCRAPDRRTMVIVEVKARVRREGQPVASATILPEAGITSAKRRHLRAVARSLITANKWHDRPVRIDVVAVEYHASPAAHEQPPLVRHYVGAV